ncbi:hypothetical protein VD0004_g4524, partial [Verticillium dahliae]
PPPATTAVPPPATTAAPPATGGAAQWAQCGGTGHTGPTTCVAPYKCNVVNQYYSQCY